MSVKRNIVQLTDMITAICYNRNGKKLNKHIVSSGYNKISNIINELIVINPNEDIVKFLIHNEDGGWTNWYDKFGRVLNKNKDYE